MFLTIKEKIEAKTIDPHLSLLSSLLDPPHLGKSLKASFSNWMLKLYDERVSIVSPHPSEQIRRRRHESYEKTGTSKR